MLAFLIEVIAVSIVVSLLGQWLKLVPRYPKLRYSFLMQAINSGLLTIVLSFFFAFKIYPSWLLMFVLMLLILWLSVRATNYVVARSGEAAKS